jgi:hypothetical protein
MVRELRKLKASISFLHTNSNALHDFGHFVAFPVGSVQLKKPAPSGSYCHSLIYGKETIAKPSFNYCTDFQTVSKKPSRWPKASIGPPCHGAPEAEGIRSKYK